MPPTTTPRKGSAPGREKPPPPADHSAQAAADLARPPLQERSRQSFDRALEAAAELLAERGSDSFTLAEVAERAGVSIGSIYGRVKSKDDLIRSVQLRELARIDAETEKAFSRKLLAGATFENIVANAIRTTANLLRQNQAILSPFMLRADTDPVIGAAGRNMYHGLVRRFSDRLLQRSADITRTSPESAVQWSFTVIYSVLARYLGLGSSQDAAGEGNWDDMIKNLTEMTISFLSSAR